MFLAIALSAPPQQPDWQELQPDLLKEFCQVASSKIWQRRSYILSFDENSISLTSDEPLSRPDQPYLAIESKLRPGAKVSTSIICDRGSTPVEEPVALPALMGTVSWIHSKDYIKKPTPLFFSKWPEQGKSVQAVRIMHDPNRPGGHHTVLFDEMGKVLQVIGGA